MARNEKDDIEKNNFDKNDKDLIQKPSMKNVMDFGETEKRESETIPKWIDD